MIFQRTRLMKKLPYDFAFGSATASVQVEGAWNEDGKLPSIWDDFCKRKGKIDNGDTVEVSADHYHRYQEDVDLMAYIGIDHYRFSISWPRVMDESLRPNEKGIAFYTRLLEALLEKGIKPAITLYHWDLPSFLQKQGGWTNPLCAYAFEAYCKLCFSRFSRYCDMWFTMNEPLCISYVSYLWGTHAPGYHSMEKTMKAVHNINLAHGLAVRAFRDAGCKGQIGPCINASYSKPATQDPRDIEAARRDNCYKTDIFTLPVFQGHYPEEILREQKVLRNAPKGDMNIISLPVDMAGLNYYHTDYVKYADNGLGAEGVILDFPMTDMPWTITVDDFPFCIKSFSEQANGIPIYITENGCAYDDVLENDGKVHDLRRIDYLRSHINAALSTLDMGVDLKGYFVWSLLDNFEWSYGYSKRFGLIYVDYMTKRRCLKDSAFFYKEFIENAKQV